MKNEKVKTERGDLVDRSRICFGLRPNTAWNPLKKYPRNAPCFCGSGKKFKVCHYGKIKDVVSGEDAKQIEADMKLILANLEKKA